LDCIFVRCPKAKDCVRQKNSAAVSTIKGKVEGKRIVLNNRERITPAKILAVMSISEHSYSPKSTKIYEQNKNFLSSRMCFRTYPQKIFDFPKARAAFMRISPISFASLHYREKGYEYGELKWYFCVIFLLRIFVFGIVVKTEISQSRRPKSAGIKIPIL
jgi:hypothetical protein